MRRTRWFGRAAGVVVALAGMAAAALPALVIGLSLPALPFAADALARLALLLSFPLLAVAFRVIHPDERVAATRAAGHFLRSWRRARA
jgi:hypothetical protein